jgi:hypothetical protein
MNASRIMLAGGVLTLSVPGIRQIKVRGAGLSLGVVLAEKNVNLRDASFPEIERFNFSRSHANENFSQTGIRLLLCQGCWFIAKLSEFLPIKPAWLPHE